jgi:hypothetical protein
LIDLGAEHGIAAMGSRWHSGKRYMDELLAAIREGKSSPPMLVENKKLVEAAADTRSSAEVASTRNNQWRICFTATVRSIAEG